MLLFQTAQTLIDAFFAMNISFYRGGIMTLIQVLGAFKNGWGYLGCFKDASLRAGIMLQKWACFQREEIQAWPDSMHRVICLKMSRTWIRWSGHESTYIYYVLESQRLEFPFQAKSLMESQKKKKKSHAECRKLERLPGFICNYAKNTEIGQTNVHWYKGNPQCLDVAYSIVLSHSDV